MERVVSAAAAGVGAGGSTRGRAPLGVEVAGSPPEVRPAGEERSVRTDALTLLFRERTFAELKGPAADAGG